MSDPGNVQKRFCRLRRRDLRRERVAGDGRPALGQESVSTGMALEFAAGRTWNRPRLEQYDSGHTDLMGEGDRAANLCNDSSRIDAASAVAAHFTGDHELLDAVALDRKRGASLRRQRRMAAPGRSAFCPGRDRGGAGAAGARPPHHCRRRTHRCGCSCLWASNSVRHMDFV